MRMLSCGRRIFFGALLLSAFFARAHQPGLSTIFVDLGSSQLTAQLILSWQEMDAIVPLDSNHDRALSEQEFAAAKTNLLKVGESALEMISDGRMLALKKQIEVQREDTTGLRFNYVYEFPPTRVLTITSDIIAELQKGHSQIVTIRSASGVELGNAVLERDKPSVDVPLFALKKTRLAESKEFFAMGLHHIVNVEAWDHLAFLFGLLVIGGTLRDVVKIVTAFTIAHSLTLALATLNVINIPPRITESLIAASIVYVGFENILRDNFSKRWMLTFAFGLIHGCGFASALRDAGVGANGTSVATPLVCFNLGVEVGQLTIAAYILPFFWRLKPNFPRRWLPTTSVILIIVGAYFLTERMQGKSFLSEKFETLMMTICVTALILTLWILIFCDCFFNKALSKTRKVAWLVIILVANTFGAWMYAIIAPTRLSSGSNRTRASETSLNYLNS